jgi:hypothetical protein
MAFDLEVDLDGNMTISETESACEIEQDGGFELVDIHFDTITKNGSTFLVNKAGFNEKLSNRLSNLHFVELGDNNTADKVKKEKEDLGWTFICNKEIFENNFTKRVLVFGKTTF